MKSLLEGFFIFPSKRKNKGYGDRGNEEKGEKERGSVESMNKKFRR